MNRLLLKFTQAVVCPKLGSPDNSIGGWLALKIMKRRNKYLEKNAVKHLNVQPDDKVLEVGFGHEIGLTAAYDKIKGGQGRVYGVDQSPHVITKTGKKLRREINSGKIDLTCCDVKLLHFDNNFFDKAFHNNSYYFWKHRELCLLELHRVLKPGAVMISVINLDSVRQASEGGAYTKQQFDPMDYMAQQEQCGFTDVHIQYHTDCEVNKPYQVLYAKVDKKDASEPTNSECGRDAKS